MSAPIRLQVGERHFTTTRDTLTAESRYFASLLSGRWDNALEDGSYFIDADPMLFDHILRYLRRGIFPLFVDMAKGHDYHLYPPSWRKRCTFRSLALRIGSKESCISMPWR